MHESLADMLKIITDSPLEPVVDKGIRGRAWLSHALWLSGLAPEAFAYKHVYRGRGASNLVAKWMEGRHNPTPLSIKGVEKSLPGTAWVFHLPAWPLLADRPIGVRTLFGTRMSVRLRVGRRVSPSCGAGGKSEVDAHETLP